jgi:hypothetical protein
MPRPEMTRLELLEHALAAEHAKLEAEARVKTQDKTLTITLMEPLKPSTGSISTASLSESQE